MREIKFRAWHKKKSKMWDLEKLTEPTGWDQVSWICNILSGDEKDFVLMQYTGLNDKNGVEIYEGDIYIPKDHTVPATIVWETQAWQCGCYLIDGSGEVIGNIYDNPELLK